LSAVARLSVLKFVWVAVTIDVNLAIRLSPAKTLRYRTSRLVLGLMVGKVGFEPTRLLGHMLLRHVYV